MKNQITTYFGILILILVSLSFSSCGPDDPQKEDVPELITKATLTFTPTGGGTPVTAIATDPDGEGIQDLKTDGTISLTAGKTYVLSIALINGLATPGTEAYDVTAEVEAEGEEHQFFFGWTNNVFASPTGGGNIGATGTVNYAGAPNAQDANGRPLGITTTWTTAAASGTTLTGKFRVLLKHQPGLKTDTSGSNVGETDLDVEWELMIH